MTRTPSAAAPCRPATRWRVAVALAFAASGWLAPAKAADTLRIAASRAPMSLPLYVAQQRGFFADEHLTVTITDCVGGTLPAPAARAARLQQSVRTTDTVARLGGDEFVIILEGINSAEEPQVVARKIVANVTSPLELEGRTLTLTTSIGVAFRRAILATDTATAETLIGRADAALYAAKKAGRNTWRVMADDVLIETVDSL